MACDLTTPLRNAKTAQAVAGLLMILSLWWFLAVGNVEHGLWQSVALTSTLVLTHLHGRYNGIGSERQKMIDVLKRSCLA